ncbi:GNAT family N-acetyltransferase [Streptomyces sp. BI20]|uniref:GNAT family N-acetyltransferase n=1 Tax=Streptomyces sp. BI20 TaxID=3403460 RepID=UPI003C774274
MSHHTQPPAARRRHHWRRDLVELAALFCAVAVADALANLVAHGPSGPVLLVGSAVALLLTAAFHTWWARRHSHAPPPDPTAPHPMTQDPATQDPALGPVPASGGALWRLRATVPDRPGSLAALCTALAGHGVDILTLQTHPLPEGATVDEFLVRAPRELPAAELTAAVTRAGGRDPWIERADAHDLVDAPTRLLALATRTALDAAELPLALRQLLGRCTIRSVPDRTLAGRPRADAAVPAEGVLEAGEMRLRDPAGGALVISRPHLPFTPTEFARARALVEMDSRLGPRVPRERDTLTLPRGEELTVRRADPTDLPAARALHQRCSEHTLGLRYHGPAADADSWLGHLLSPRFGRTLAVTAGPDRERIVALGHLLWDGDETEVALLVEDEWQRRGVGSELLGRLIGLAEEAGCASVYAVTRSSNTGMVAAMRGLGLPLDYQVEEGTLVITARLDGADARAAAPEPVRGEVRPERS